MADETKIWIDVPSDAVRHIDRGTQSIRLDALMQAVAVAYPLVRIEPGPSNEILIVKNQGD